MKSAFLFQTTVLGAAIALVASVGVGCFSSSSSLSPTAACQRAYASIVAYDQACSLHDASLGDEDRYVQACVLELNAPGAVAVSALEQCTDAVDGAKATCGTVDDVACPSATGTLATGSPCGEGIQCRTGYCKASDPTSRCGVCTDRIPAGQPCSSGDACAYGTSCVSGTGDTPTCTAKPLKNDVGGSCSAPGTACKDGLRCDLGSGTCVALGAAGAACGTHDDCESQLRCVGGTCAPAKGAGQACSSGECAPGLGCDLQSKTCSALVTVEPGQPCDYAVNLCRVGFCQLTTSLTGTCPAVIPDGQPCDATSGSATCGAEASCVNGACAIFDPSSCK
jgi:hypothetical protein